MRSVFRPATDTLQRPGALRRAVRLRAAQAGGAAAISAAATSAPIRA